MSATANRLPLIDALKALASQVIVLHHFAAYGPLSLAFEDLAPTLQGWLYDYGRIAVQVFLVVAGFLAARSLAPRGRAAFKEPHRIILKRYLRLVPPFAAALALAILCSTIARTWMDDEAIPDPATLRQYLVHIALAHGIAGTSALSAGVWYVAIDFQLFALFTLLIWLGGRLGGKRVNAAPFLVATLAAASLFYFNRDSTWDDWGIYFFGSYALGAAALWASDRDRSTSWLGALWAVGVFALVVDFRLRIAVALGVALTLGIVRRVGLFHHWPEFRPVEFLGRISFSIFLIHFPVYLLVNALFERYGDGSASQAAFTLIAAWLTSIAAGYTFFRQVESRPARYWPQQAAAVAAVLLGRLGFR